MPVGGSGPAKQSVSIGFPRLKGRPGTLYSAEAVNGSNDQGGGDLQPSEPTSPKTGKSPRGAIYRMGARNQLQ